MMMNVGGKWRSINIDDYRQENIVVDDCIYLYVVFDDDID